MPQRLEVHRDYSDFFCRELDALADGEFLVSYSALFEACREAANAEFDQVTREYCAQLTWPLLSGHERVRACVRLHFACWYVNALPWETTEEPLNGAAYLEDILIRRFWLHRQQWIAANWAGCVLDSCEDEDE